MSIQTGECDRFCLCLAHMDSLVFDESAKPLLASSGLIFSVHDRFGEKIIFAPYSPNVTFTR